MNPILARINGDPHLHGVCFYAAIPIIMVAATVASTAYTAYSQIQQGNEQADAQKYNAEVAQQEATEANQVAQTNAEQQEEQTKQTVGQELANAAASGVDPSQGSPLEVMSSTATQGELQKQLILWQGQYNASNYLNTAQLQSFYSANSSQAGVINAGGTLLSGASSVGTQFANEPALGGTPGTVTSAPKF